jgi:hypothetical protein
MRQCPVLRRDLKQLVYGAFSYEASSKARSTKLVVKFVVRLAGHAVVCSL